MSKIKDSIMTPDQIDPHLKKQVDCRASWLESMANNLVWHLNRIDNPQDRNAVLEMVRQRMSRFEPILASRDDPKFRFEKQ
jgi:hypothetical protein